MEEDAFEELIVAEEVISICQRLQNIGMKVNLAP
jgi:hypothetical protein